jgi:hypothetical protein
MKKLFIIAAIAICFGITTSTFAQKGKPNPSPTPTPTPPPSPYVTAEFLEFGADGMPNKVTMDRPGVPYSHNVEGVTAQFYIGGSDDLVIAMNSSKAKRTAKYNFSEGSDHTNAPIWVYTNPIQTFKPFINVLQAYKAKTGCAPVDSIYNCNFQTRMNNGYLSASGDSASYALLFNPETINNRPVNSPENTSFVNVNYYKGTDGKEVFTITPLPNCATRENNFTCGETDLQKVIAGLEKTSGKTVSGAGQYVMPFILVVRPK